MSLSPYACQPEALGLSKWWVAERNGDPPQSIVGPPPKARGGSYPCGNVGTAANEKELISHDKMLNLPYWQM